jgi:polyphenol oxidase
VLTFPGLAGVAGLAHGVSTRQGGVSTGAFASLNLGRRTPDRREDVEENRRRAAGALGFAAFVGPRQVHGVRIAEVRDAADDPGEADGLTTDRPGVLLGVLGADCPGVLLVDPARGALALVHAGWRGVAGGIVPAAVEALARRYGSRPDALRVAVGPGIGPEAYEVGPEVADALRAAVGGDGPGLARGRGDRWHADLGALIERQLVSAGVPHASVERDVRCTWREADLLFSHRRDGERAGRHALLAGWRATT